MMDWIVIFCDAWVDGLVGRDPLFLATRNVVAVVTLHFGARVSPCGETPAKPPLLRSKRGTRSVAEQGVPGFNVRSPI